MNYYISLVLNNAFDLVCLPSKQQIPFAPSALTFFWEMIF